MKAAAGSFHHRRTQKHQVSSPSLLFFFFSPSSTLNEPLQNQLAKSHFTKVAGFCFQKAAPGPQVTQNQLKVAGGEACYKSGGIRTNKEPHISHHTCATCSSRTVNRERLRSKTAHSSGVNLRALRPLQVSVSTVLSTGNCPGRLTSWQGRPV